MYADVAASEFYGFAHFEMKPLDLAVIEIQSAFLQSILGAFDAVVEVPPPVVRREKRHPHLQLSGKRLHILCGEDRHDLFPVKTALPADEHPGADVPVIMVYRRRIGNFQFGHLLPDGKNMTHFLAHGGCAF